MDNPMKLGFQLRIREKCFCHWIYFCLKYFQELTKERVKSAAVLKSLEEKLEEKLKTELEQKVPIWCKSHSILNGSHLTVVTYRCMLWNSYLQEMEVEQKLKQMRDIAKAELAAAIAREKASQIEKMAEADLHVWY